MLRFEVQVVACCPSNARTPLDLGARHVETAASVTEALNAIGRQQPSFALLDLNLGNENSIAVGNRLVELGIPFIFATGYSERAAIPSELDKVPVIQKPYTRDTIELAMGTLKSAGALSPT
jgi:DNA-binding LytR/AlgR family response regulator